MFLSMIPSVMNIATSELKMSLFLQKGKYELLHGLYIPMLMPTNSQYYYVGLILTFKYRLECQENLYVD